MENELRIAYLKYREVFPQYFDPKKVKPQNISDFPRFHTWAKNTAKEYQDGLAKGKLDPFIYFLKTNLDQFLGIPHTPTELTYAHTNFFSEPGI